MPRASHSDTAVWRPGSVAICEDALMEAHERQRRYGDDVPWERGVAAVEAFLEGKATDLGITVDTARDVARHARGGSLDRNDFTFDQAHMAIEMGHL